MKKYCYEIDERELEAVKRLIRLRHIRRNADYKIP